MLRRHTFLAAIFFLLSGNSISAELAAHYQAISRTDVIIVTIDNKVFTAYHFGQGQKYPFFFPVNGPASQISLTTDAGIPYPHHRSLWFGCDKVNGGNYWQEGNDKGQIISQGAKITLATKDKIVINDECFWQQPNEQPIIIDKRTITVTSPSNNIRLIDFTITLIPQTTVQFQKSNHSLFAARVNPLIAVDNGGQLINANGGQKAEGTFSKEAKWCDYSGFIAGYNEGIAIFDSPQNMLFPNKWFTRDYGFFSPTPMYWLENDVMELKKDENLKLTYRVVVHSGTILPEQLNTLYDEWTSAE